MKRRLLTVLLLAAVLLPFPLAAGCGGQSLSSQLAEITRPYRFSVVSYEVNAFFREIGRFFTGLGKATGSGTEVVTEYFANVEQVRNLQAWISASREENGADTASLEDELARLQARNAALVATVEKTLETQIRATLSQQGIYNPLYEYLGLKIGFPPVNFSLEMPPHLLVVSPRDRIERLRDVILLPDMSPEDIERIEEEVDGLGYSSLVVELGGIATYPSFVRADGDLRNTLAAAAEEWFHQYLAFKPLGFGYVLDLTGIRRDSQIVTMNETLASMVSDEIADIICENYYGLAKPEVSPPGDTGGGFDFNKDMRELRKTVDEYLAQGKIEEAEALMEQERQFLATQGYYIRKLNQAYFAFFGTYADSPTSVDPIGVELQDLRKRSVSLREFVETVASMNSRQDLDASVE